MKDLPFFLPPSESRDDFQRDNRESPKYSGVLEVMMVHYLRNSHTEPHSSATEYEAMFNKIRR